MKFENYATLSKSLKQKTSRNHDLNPIFYLFIFVFSISGSDDATVKIWEVATGRCMKTILMAGKVTCVVWNPNPSMNLVAATV